MTKAPKPKAKAQAQAPRDAVIEAASRALQKLFGENVRRYRMEAGISQRGLAAATGLSHRHLSLIELSGANVTIDTIVMLAKHVDRTPIELLTPPPPRAPRKR